MKFETIGIKNFRNFESIDIKLSNKNVFFGMNDIGKTNFLFALRYVFERDIRKRDLVESDFYRHNTDNDIQICVCIDISDFENADTQKLLAKLKGAVQSDDTHVYIKLIAKYNSTIKAADIQMFWGGNLDSLQEMFSSTGFFALDNVFNVFYINSYIDIQDLIKKNIKKLIKNDESTEESDANSEKTIKEKIIEINTEIAKMSGVSNYANRLTSSYQKMRDDNISICIRSDFAINSLYSSIIPFIHQNDDDNDYPTSGEGRKKLLAYSIYDILSDDTSESRINLFLIEEPETHLHKAMQSSLSYFLFNSGNDNKFNYLFVSTHSPYVLSEMDEVNLVRIVNQDKITSKSLLYSVPKEWKTIKKKLNRSLAEAIFTDSVLLVEGESECILFEKVLSQIDPYYESKGIYILSVEGVGFKKYINILNGLGIKYALKTDNDMKKVASSNPPQYYSLGFERINNLVNLIDSSGKNLIEVNKTLDESYLSTAARGSLYDENKQSLDTIRETYNIFLSHSGLEEDLLECLGEDQFMKILGKDTAEKALKLLKSKKKHMMAELVENLSDIDCKAIYDHYNFACLKAVCE